jgi:hypothetical protein
VQLYFTLFAPRQVVLIEVNKAMRTAVPVCIHSGRLIGGRAEPRRQRLPFEKVPQESVAVRRGCDLGDDRHLRLGAVGDSLLSAGQERRDRGRPFFRSGGFCALQSVPESRRSVRSDVS